MATRALGVLQVPILIGACGAASAPPRDGAQAVHAPASAEVVAVPPPPIPVSPRPRAKPLHPVEEKVEIEPKVEPKPRVSRRDIDRTRIEARGATRFAGRMDARFAAAAWRAVVPSANQAWSVDQRRDLLAFLRGHAVEGDPQFTEADVRIVAHLQAGSSAKSDGVISDETLAIFFAMGFRPSPRKAAGQEVKLEFYPAEFEDLAAWNREIDEKITKNHGDYEDVVHPIGEGTLYVRVGGSIVARYRARGGPPSPLEHGDHHIAEPTAPGGYLLGSAHPHVTSSWHYSQLPWGAELRAHEGGYQYRWPGRQPWEWATAHHGNHLKEPIAVSDIEDLPEVTRDGVSYRIWNKNDFGPLAWNLEPSIQYVHTTVAAEAELAAADAADAGPPSAVTVTLTASHGCIHVDPRERDEMMARGYLGKDIPILVRRWNEYLLPDEIRRELLDATTPP